MTVRVGINGFGRIGRNILRAIAEASRKDIQVVAVNDLGPVETNAHLLRYDSVHGRFPGEVTVKGDTIDVGNGAIKVTAERDPTKLPWKDLGIDIAMECTGIFTAKEKASAHLTAGAKRVLVSAPADGAAFSGGSIVPIRWSASDDEALHAFDIQASYDGGRTFHAGQVNVEVLNRSFLE